jgi:hypothetical protein
MLLSPASCYFLSTLFLNKPVLLMESAFQLKEVGKGSVQFSHLDRIVRSVWLRLIM